EDELAGDLLDRAEQDQLREQHLARPEEEAQQTGALEQVRPHQPEELVEPDLAQHDVAEALAGPAVAEMARRVERDVPQSACGEAVAGAPFEVAWVAGLVDAARRGDRDGDRRVGLEGLAAAGEELRGDDVGG